jgi:TPR repeat protein
MYKLRTLLCVLASIFFSTILPSFGAKAADDCACTEKLNDGLIAYVNEDFPLALRILESASEANDPVAQLLLGRMLASGQGTQKNCELAIYWLQRAASGGNGEAAFDLASFAEHGRCMKQNISAAIICYELAAAEGNDWAPNALGEIYLRTQGSAPNYAKASFWFRRGARSYDARSFYHLGEMYANGQGVEKDLIEAYKWFDLSAETDAPNGSRLTAGAVARDKVREDLMPAQAGEGKNRSIQWMTEHGVRSASNESKLSIARRRPKNELR